MKITYMYKNEPVAEITTSIDSDKVFVYQIRHELMDKPFGGLSEVSSAMLEEFLESRCFPRERHSCKQLLKELGLDIYDPLSIVLKTHGQQYDDYYWLKFEGAEVDWDDIKMRT